MAKHRDEDIELEVRGTQSGTFEHLKAMQDAQGGDPVIIKAVSMDNLLSPTKKIRHATSKWSEKTDW